jgi:hypothetical protein
MRLVVGDQDSASSDLHNVTRHRQATSSSSRSPPRHNDDRFGEPRCFAWPILRTRVRAIHPIRDKGIVPAQPERHSFVSGIRESDAWHRPRRYRESAAMEGTYDQPEPSNDGSSRARDLRRHCSLDDDQHGDSSSPAGPVWPRLLIALWGITPRPAGLKTFPAFPS